MWRTCRNTTQTENPSAAGDWALPFLRQLEKEKAKWGSGYRQRALTHATCWFLLLFYFYFLLHGVLLLNHKILHVKCRVCWTGKAIRGRDADVPSLDLPQHLGRLDGMQKKSDDIKMATVPSVTYLMRKHAESRFSLNYHHFIYIPSVLCLYVNATNCFASVLHHI